jgi:hypothetical protein
LLAQAAEAVTILDGRRVVADPVVPGSYLPRMPRLSAFYGIVIYMYWADHAPPHFHAIYGGSEAQVLIENGRVLAGSLPRTAARLVREWTALHRAELLEDWRLAQASQDLLPIDGLQ